MRGYFAIKSLCLRLDLPIGDEFFTPCMVRFARAFGAAFKGSETPDFDFLRVIAVYQQTLVTRTSMPLPKILKVTGEVTKLKTYRAGFPLGISLPPRLTGGVPC